MEPIVKVVVDGDDITDQVMRRLVSLTVKDSAGRNADTLTLVLDDEGGELELPRKGVSLSVSAGFLGRKFGALGDGFVVDEVSVGGPPSSMTIVARAANFIETLKDQKSRSFDSILLKDLVAFIAVEHGLTARVSDKFSTVFYDHLDQTDESDINFLMRLAVDLDAVAKPVGKYLLFVSRGESRTASGKAMPRIPLTVRDFSTWRAVLPERGKFKSVVARWHDDAGASLKEVVVGSGAPAFRLQNTYATAAEAEVAAEAKLKAVSRSGGKFSGSLVVGDPEIVAEARLPLSFFREGVDGEWVVDGVTHAITKQGYVCSVTCEPV